MKIAYDKMELTSTRICTQCGLKWVGGGFHRCIPELQNRIAQLEDALRDGQTIATSAPTSGDLAEEWRGYLNRWHDRASALLGYVPNPSSEQK